MNFHSSLFFFFNPQRQELIIKPRQKRKLSSLITKTKLEERMDGVSERENREIFVVPGA